MSTIQIINNEVPVTARPKINANFAALNADKIEVGNLVVEALTGTKDGVNTVFLASHDVVVVLMALQNGVKLTPTDPATGYTFTTPRTFTFIHAPLVEESQPEAFYIK